MNKAKQRLITHNGSFHTDDIFAAAALSLMLSAQGKDFEIIRTRDEEIIKTGDYVFDVGGVYDPGENRFDHHQPGGAGRGPQDIEYSSLGLVWQKFGGKIAGSERAAQIIEKRLCAPIDAVDNGIDLTESKGEVAPYYIQTFFHAMVPTWKESDENIDQRFFECVDFAKKVLTREIIQARDLVEAETAVLQIYKQSADKRIIILDQNYPFEYILSTLPESLYAIYPRRSENGWGVKAIRKDMKTFDNRKDLPQNWAGMRDEEFQKISGVADATFCHRALFFCAAKSKEGAMRLATIAANS